MSAERQGIPPSPLPPLHDWDGAARILHVTPRFVRALWARREIGGSKIGKLVRFSDSDLANYVEAHHVEPKR